MDEIEPVEDKLKDIINDMDNTFIFDEYDVKPIESKIELIIYISKNMAKAGKIDESEILIIKAVKLIQNADEEKIEPISYLNSIKYISDAISSINQIEIISRKEILNDLIDIIESKLKRDKIIAEAKRNLAQTFADIKDFNSALSINKSINIDKEKALTLSYIAKTSINKLDKQALTEFNIDADDLFSQAVKIAEKMNSEGDKSYILSEIIKHLSDCGKFEKAFELINNFDLK